MLRLTSKVGSLVCCQTTAEHHRLLLWHLKMMAPVIRQGRIPSHMRPQMKSLPSSPHRRPKSRQEVAGLIVSGIATGSRRLQTKKIDNDNVGLLGVGEGDHGRG